MENRLEKFLQDALVRIPAPGPGATRAEKKNYTESLSHEITAVLAAALGEAAALLGGISGRRRPEDAPELYEVVGVVLFDPGEPSSLDLFPEGVPTELQGGHYVRQMVERFRLRNPFYRL